MHFGPDRKIGSVWKWLCLEAALSGAPRFYLEVAAAVTFLASEAADAVTGQVLRLG